MARHFGSAMPYRWEIVRPFDRYGEAASPDFASEADAIRFGVERGWGAVESGAIGPVTTPVGADSNRD